MSITFDSILESDEHFSFPSMTASAILSTGTYSITPNSSSSIYKSAVLDSSNITLGHLNTKSDVYITNEDIFIKGVGLNERLSNIEKRLDILVINPKLEAKYEQLKKLGEEYRALEKELLDKDKVWEILNK